MTGANRASVAVASFSIDKAMAERLLAVAVAMVSEFLGDFIKREIDEKGIEVALWCANVFVCCRPRSTRPICPSPLSFLFISLSLFR